MYDQALSSVDKALEIDPRFVEAWITKGLTLQYSKKYNEAIFCYAKTLEIDPANELALQNMKVVYSSKKNKPSFDRTINVTWDRTLGKKVKSSDEKDLGRITSISRYYIETKEAGRFSKKHFFLPKYYLESYDGNDIWISLTKDEVSSKFEQKSHTIQGNIIYLPGIEGFLNSPTQDYLERRKLIESEFPQFQQGIPIGKIIKSNNNEKTDRVKKRP